MADFLRSVAESNCFRRFCRPVPNPSANRPFCSFARQRYCNFTNFQKKQIYFSNVTLVAPTFPPIGGFSLAIFILT